MPTYNYRCTEHGDFEEVHSIADRFTAVCPADSCGSPLKIVILTAPPLDIEAMSKMGMPSAWETVGKRITERHRSVDQHHRPAGQ